MRRQPWASRRIWRRLATRRWPWRRRRRRRGARRTRRPSELAREDYINRVNRAYREIQDDNIALAEDLLHGCEPERRGWEWHFVERLCNSERRVIDLANTSAAALAYSPDGSLGGFRVGRRGRQPAGGGERRHLGRELRPAADEPARCQRGRLVRGDQPGRHEGRRRRRGRPRHGLGQGHGAKRVDPKGAGVGRHERGLQPRRQVAGRGLRDLQQ